MNSTSRTRNVPRLQRRAPRPRAAHRDGGFPRRGRAPFLGRLFAAASSDSSQARTTLIIGTRKRSASPPPGAITIISATSSPTPTRRTPNGRATPRFTGRTRTPTDGRTAAKSCRVSGKVDSVRLPKQAYYVYRVMQSDAPDIHIIGHWTYPTNTVKTIYVAANHCDSVELFVNGKSQGVVDQRR